MKTNALKPKPFEQKDLTVESEDLSSCESDCSSHSWSRDEDTEDSESDTSMRSKVNKRKYHSTTESVAQKERKHGNSNQLNKTLENGFPTSTPAKKDKTKIKDKHNKKIFIRKIVKAKGAGRNIGWNQVHACKFCNKIRTNISKHLRKHKNNEINEILKMSKELGKKHKTVRAMWDMVRNEGDNKQNLKTLENGSGEMIIGRRPDDISIVDIDQFGLCPGCKVWIKLDKTMYRHQSLCPAKVLGLADNCNVSTKELKIKALQASGKISKTAI